MPPSAVPRVAEDTLMVFSSDHGELLDNHQQILKGPQRYGDLTRVPRIARWPGRIAPGTDVAELVQWIALPATFLEASSCAPGRGVQGRSLLPLAAGHDVIWRHWARSENRYSGFTTDPRIMTTMLRFGNWKPIVRQDAPTCGNARDGELYNLAEDPGELHNLYHQPGNIPRSAGGFPRP